MTRLIDLVIAVGVVVGICASAAAQDGITTRSYDIRVLTLLADGFEPSLDLVPPVASAVNDSMCWSNAPHLLGDEEGAGLPGLDFGMIVERLRLPNSVDVEGPLLKLAATEAQHAQFHAILHELEVELSRHVLIDVLELPNGLGEDVGQHVLTAAEASAVVARSGVLWIGRGRGRLGRRISIGSLSSEAFLADWNVEENSTLQPEPRVAVLPSGQQVNVCALETAGGDFELRVRSRKATTLGPLRRVRIYPAGHEVELPAARFSLIAASGSIPNGGALLVPGEGRATLLIRARYAPGSEPRPNRRSLWTSRWTNEVVLQFGWDRMGLAPSGFWEGAYALPDPNETRTGLPSGEMFDVEQVLHSLTRSIVGGEAPWSSPVRGLVFDVPAQGRSAIENLEHRVFPTFGIEVRWDTLPTSEAVDLVVSSALPEDFLKGRGHRISGTVCAGQSFFFEQGRDRAYVRDHDVEFSMGTYPPAPIVSSRIDGIALAIAPAPARGGRIAVAARLQWLEPLTSFEVVPVDLGAGAPSVAAPTRKSSIVETSSEATALLSTVAEVGDGEWIPLGMAPLPGTSRTLVATVRVRRLDTGF